MVGKYGVKEEYGGQIWWANMVGKYVGQIWWANMVGKYGVKYEYGGQLGLIGSRAQRSSGWAIN